MTVYQHYEGLVAWSNQPEFIYLLQIKNWRYWHIGAFVTRTSIIYRSRQVHFSVLTNPKRKWSSRNESGVPETKVEFPKRKSEFPKRK